MHFLRSFAFPERARPANSSLIPWENSQQSRPKLRMTHNKAGRLMHPAGVTDLGMSLDFVDAVVG